MHLDGDQSGDDRECRQHTSRESVHQGPHCRAVQRGDHRVLEGTHPEQDGVVTGVQVVDQQQRGEQHGRDDQGMQGTEGDSQYLRDTLCRQQHPDLDQG